ncbi:MAG: MFS transporter [Bryobacteraceae bacterium]|nr:MFS transporter [Bryobacteraceae bacterium]MDW8377084.1 MFS transporter [Bryobacterales bacterium]
MARRSFLVLVALLLGSTTINYVDRQVLSVLAPVLRDEFAMSNEEYAWVVNAFMVSYAVSMPLAGWVLDRIGVGRGLLLSVVWWSAAGMFTALAQGPGSLAVARAALAVGQSGAWPAFAKATAIWVPPQWSSMVIGICNSGSSFGSMIAPPFVVWLTGRWGWRAAFVITGALGFIWVAAFELFRRATPPMRESVASPFRSQSGVVGWQRLLAFRQTWIVFVCRFLADPIWYFYVFWIPEFLARERGLSLAAVGAVAWIPFLVSAIANFVPGVLAQRLTAWGWSVGNVRRFLMLIGAAGSPLGLAAVHAQTIAMTMTFICVAIFFWMIWSVTVQTLPGDFFPQQAVASVYGLGGLGSTLGSVLATWLVGKTLDWTHSYEPVFLGLALLMPVAFVVGMAVMGRLQPLKQEELLSP